MRFHRLAIIPAAVAASLTVLAPARAETSQEAPFLAVNQAAMDKMMAGMDIKPTGDVDHDFIAMMIPHHQGAIDMAEAELLYGHDEKLVRIAQEIVVEQLQEIAAMRLAIGEPASPTWVTNGAHDASAAPSHQANPNGDAVFLSRSNAAMDKMMADMAVKPTGEVDHDFVAMMVPHHQGAIDMARAELQYGQTPQLKTIAQEIVVDQQQEITLMRVALGEPLPPLMSSPTQASSGAIESAPRLRHEPDPHADVPSDADRSRPNRTDPLTQGLPIMETRGYLSAALLAGTALAGLSPAFAGQAPYGASAPNIPVGSHDRVYTGEQFSNTVSVIDPSDNKTARRDPAGCSDAGEFQPAVQGPGTGARHGLLAGSSHHRRGLDRLQLRHLHRHRDQHGEAHHLCRTLAARGLLHARRQGGVGHRARRELRRRARRQDLRGEDPDHHAARPGHDDLLAGRQIRLRLLVVQSRDRRRSPSPSHKIVGDGASRQAPSARISRRRRTASRSGSP